MIILGYAGYNLTLRKEHILINRTCRLETVKKKGLLFLEDLFFRNLSDLYKTLQWNADQKIKFYRISSDIAPQITNPSLIQNNSDFTQLAFDLEKYKKYFKIIGDFSKKAGIRLTFHPDLFNVLNSPDPEIVLRTFRDLYYHTKMLDLMELDYNSVIILHGGGVYGNKIESKKRFIENFKKLPPFIQSRICLENDETLYNFEDILEISQKIGPILIPDLNPDPVPVPIVFDIFHYYCYNDKIRKNNQDPEFETLPDQKSIEKILPICQKTWVKRNMKIHLSEQLIDPKKKIPIGSHSDFIQTIPEELLKFGKNNLVYMMCECKMKEICMLELRKKYSDYCL